MSTTEGQWSQVIENKEFKTEGLSLRGKSKVLIRNCDFSVNKSDDTMLSLSNCKDCRVEGCKFHDKDSKGVGLKIAGEDTKRIVVDNCEFYDLTYSKDNGGEPIRIGNSHSSGVWFDCTVRNCYFHNLKADPETVSIKSCGNVIENCKHENCKSSFVIRHGGFAKIRNNRFKGEGGIRIYGYGNEITGNHFEDNQSERFPPITLGAGDVEKDPNFSASDKPTGREGSSHSNYAQINNNTIKDNTYQNCKRTIVKRTDEPLKPINSDIQDLEEAPAASEVDELEQREAKEEREEEEKESNK
jgi:poly(beta-D-mannuronate) lyase